jgi:putative NADH-flavin reductase
MRLTILGATGGIGRLLLPMALEQGHEVTAFARAPEKITRNGSRLHVVGGDLFNAQQMASAIHGSDAVLSAFGPTTLRRTHLRRDFGRTVVKALRTAGVSRFLHVSSALLFPDGGMLVKVMSNTLMRNVAADHQDCDAELVQPDLAWTIVRPPRLLDGPPTGRARILAGHLPKGGFTITRADVAAFMLQETVKPNFIRQVVGISK